MRQNEPKMKKKNCFAVKMEWNGWMEWVNFALAKILWLQFYLGHKLTH